MILKLQIFLRITFSGDICHKQGEISARKIRGEERNLIKSVFAGRSHTPGDLFRKKVASLSGDEFASGNRQGTGRQTKAFRHISAEAKRDQRLPSLLAKNLTELDEKLKKDDIEKCSKSQINKRFYGFIASTDVTSDSLRITLLDEGGVRLYHSVAPKDIIYIDATGTVVENIAQFKRLLLYSFTTRNPFGLSPPYL